MATFYMYCGVSGSGKTYKAYEMHGEDAIIIDSDQTREKLLGSADRQDQNSLVFEHMWRKTIEYIERGVSVAYVATNLSARRRISFLKSLHKRFPSLDCTCYIINCSIETARARNSARSRVVPSYVLDRQIRQFEVPTYGEGWHHIEIIDNNVDNAQDKVRAIATYEARVKEFGSQQNSHHLLDLYDHCRMASHWACENGCDEDIVSAAYLHDWGKAWTATRWEKDNYKEVHYPNHANVSAVLALNMGASLEVVALINYHMLLYSDAACQRTWRNRLGEKLWGKLVLLHKADEAAH